MMLISPEYQAEQARLHAEREDYGVASLQYANIVGTLIAKLEVDSILDYGCGKGRLAMAFHRNPPQRSFAMELYDPAIERYAGLPDPADMVISIDVLEHIEPELLDDVLDHIKQLARHYVFLTIHTGPAVKTLSDGRNAHLTQEGAVWWMPKLLARWSLVEAKSIGPGFVFIGKAIEG